MRERVGLLAPPSRRGTESLIPWRSRRAGSSRTSDMPLHSAAQPLLPPTILAILIGTVVVAAAFANCALLTCIFKRSRNGIHIILLQIAITDIIKVFITIPAELWSFNSKTWPFSHIGCLIYKGLDVLVSTASIYLTAALALHSLGIVNMEEKNARRRFKRTQEIEDDELRSSRHSLVAASDSSTPPRTMNLDYMLSNNRLPVIPPMLFVWILASSMSVPEFTLSYVREEGAGGARSTTCSRPDTSFSVMLHGMLAMFSIVIPTFIFCVVIALAFAKLRSVKKFSDVYNSEATEAIKLSIYMIYVCMLCMPRSGLTFYLVYSSSIGQSFESLSDFISVLHMLFNGINLLATLVRPLLCVFCMSNLKTVFIKSTKERNVNIL